MGPWRERAPQVSGIREEIIFREGFARVEGEGRIMSSWPRFPPYAPFLISKRYAIPYAFNAPRPPRALPFDPAPPVPPRPHRILIIPGSALQALRRIPVPRNWTVFQRPKTAIRGGAWRMGRRWPLFCPFSPLPDVRVEGGAPMG